MGIKKTIVLMIVSVDDLIHGSRRAHSDISNLYMTICTAKRDLMLTALHLLIFIFNIFFRGREGWIYYVLNAIPEKLAFA